MLVPATARMVDLTLAHGSVRDDVKEQARNCFWAVTRQVARRLEDIRRQAGPWFL